MGTRADFYLGRGVDAEWLGSISFDGYPEGLPEICRATTEDAYRTAVAARLAEDDGTTPDQGWPWPWNDSSLTDYAYAWEGGHVWACSGHTWFDATGPEPEDDVPGGMVAVFSNMKDRQRVAWDRRSGLIVLRASDQQEELLREEGESGE